MDYFVEMTTHVPEGTPDEAVDDIRAREAVRAGELAAQGHLNLTTLTLTVPDGTVQDTVDDLKAREAVRARELAGQGRLIRLWTPPNEPGQWRTLGLWSARDAADLTATLESLPLYEWMTIEATPLTPHPSDPVRGTQA